MRTVTTKNYKVRLQFAKDIVERMGIDEIRRYKKEFGWNTPQTIYEYVKAITYALPLVETFKDMEV